jgi:hypothetical protein
MLLLLQSIVVGTAFGAPAVTLEDDLLFWEILGMVMVFLCCVCGQRMGRRETARFGFAGDRFCSFEFMSLCRLVDKSDNTELTNREKNLYEFAILRDRKA